MRKGKYIALCGIMVASLSMVSLTGCGGKTTESNQTSEKQTEESQTTGTGNSFTYSDSEKETPAAETINGIVETIENNEITIGIMQRGGGQPGEKPEGTPGEMPQGENGEKPEGTPGEMPQGENGEKPEGTPGEMPQGENGEKPEGTPGEMPQGEDGQNSPNMETAVVTISDESVIKVAGEEATEDGSLSDITEKSMLSITFDENGEITEILVNTGMGQKAN